MNKKQLFIILLMATAIILLSLINLSKSSTKNENAVNNQVQLQTPADYQAKVVISATEEDLNIEYEAQGENTYQPFSLLEEALNQNNIPLEVENYDFGVFVKSINGIESSNDKAWIYFVNGESGQVAADKMDLKKGDVVEWKYITPSM